MPIWERLLDSAAGVLLLVVLLGVALILRRRLLSRNGGTFEVSYRIRLGSPAGRGWLLGEGRYSGEQLEWFRIFSLSPKPKRVWDRHGLVYVRQREPVGVEQLSLYPGHVVIQCDTPGGPVELAMGRSALMGFQSWLEAAPPGTARHL